MDIRVNIQIFEKCYIQLLNNEYLSEYSDIQNMIF